MVVASNPYANQDLFVTTAVRERLEDFVSRSEKDAKPFPRQVDAWWLAIGIGVQLGQRTKLSDNRVKFNDGGVLGSDPWRITHLELLALAEEGEDVLDSPAQVMRIASEFANTGFEWLLDQLLGHAEATLTLMNCLSDIS